MSDPELAAQVQALLPARRGHFRLESGHHGELWLELERLFLRPAALQPLAGALAQALAPHQIEAVCGPLIEGAFLATMVAQALDVPFTYSVPRTSARGGLFPVDYPLPAGLHQALAGRRVAVVNDVINAGSAVRGTLASLRTCGARPVAVAALAVLGPDADRLAAEADLPLEALVRLPNQLWLPDQCPLCARGVPLT